MTDKTAIQRIKELDEERATLFEQAKEEALRRANQAVEDLNALGLWGLIIAWSRARHPLEERLLEVRAPLRSRRKQALQTRSVRPAHRAEGSGRASILLVRPQSRR